MLTVPQAVFIVRDRCINCGSRRLKMLSRGKYRDDPLHSFLTADPWGVDPLPHLQEAIWSLVQCEDCSQVFHERILNEEWNERRFSEWMSQDAIRAFEAKYSPNSQFRFATSRTEHVVRIERLTRELRGSAGVALLDFGCGFGSFLEVCKHFGFDAVGVDRSSARREGAMVNVHADLTEIRQRQFHAITLFEVLEHVDEPAEILKLLHRHLAPGGILVLETPDCTGVVDIATRHDYVSVHPLEHINAFTHKTLKSIAGRCGFEHINRGLAIVTSELPLTAKKLIKYAAGKGEASTQLYFRRV